MVLVCDATGGIRERLRLDDVQGRPARFLDYLDSPSKEKGRSFLAETWARGRAVGWTLVIDANPPVEMTFGAVRQGDQMIVIGVGEDGALLDTVESLTELDAPTLTDLRERFGEAPEPARGGYERMSELNNELANAHRALAKQSQELRRLNVEKDRILAMAAHDIRSPLTVVLNYGKLLARDDLEAADRDLAVSEVTEAARFVLRLVEDLLDVSAIESGKVQIDRKRVDPIEETERNLRRLQPLAADRGIGLDLSVRGVLPHILLDPLRYRQILDNLVMNAVKFSPVGSVVRIQLRAKEEVVELSVLDDGPGIPTAAQRRLFEPFERVGESGAPGTGLGLSIVKQLVQLHGGSVGLESQEGSGSRFFALFPVN